jgi:xanthine dehydrogenase large subunit
LHRDEYQVTREQVEFEANVVRIGNQRIPFPIWSIKAYMARIHLSAAGFYKTPDIHWTAETGKGNPFYYFAYGAAVSEVSIDTLTGEYHVDRTDLLHDVGKSLNPAIDIGQVEGAFIQGMGWLTTEELWWDDKGPAHPRALNLQDPAGFRQAACLQRQSGRLVREPGTDHQTVQGCWRTAVHAGVSVFEALSMAVASVADYRECPRLDAPATPERVLLAVERLKAGG